MTDRFKFRAGFTISFYDIAGNDVERQIILDSCFSIDNGGEGICVNETIIQEALDIYVAKDEHKTAWDFINANYAETDGYYFIDSVDFLDQCTGLKDKNGKLIYEGDIVRESPYNKYFEYADYVVSWKDGAYTNEKCLGMKNKETGEIKDCSKGGYCFSKHIHQELADDFEVIGNIHENRDLMEQDNE